MFNWLKSLFHRPQTGIREKWISSFVSFFYIFGLGMASGGMSPKTMEFYNALQKPSLVPPNWVFPVAWTILFALIGLSGYYAWNQFKTNGLRRLFAGLYAVNGVLVYLWSHLFFERQNIMGGLFVIVAMLIVIESMILVGFRNNAKSAYLLLPYFLWVLFATYLNIAIIALNP
jgi:translocator protein